MTANELTAKLLIDITKKFPNIRVWRQNTGGGIGVGTVKSAVALLRNGMVAEAIRLLTSRPIKFGLNGTADIMGIIGPNGRMLQVEVKVGKDQMFEDQRGIAAMVSGHGGVYLVARDTPDAVMGALRVLVERHSL